MTEVLWKMNRRSCYYIECVAASRRGSRTRRFWTTCCLRRGTTNGFCLRFKVYCGPRPTPVKTTTLPTSNPMTQTTLSTQNATAITQHNTTTVYCSLLVEWVFYTSTDDWQQQQITTFLTFAQLRRRERCSLFFLSTLLKSIIHCPYRKQHIISKIIHV